MKLRSKLIGLNLFGQIMFAVIFFGALYFSYNSIVEKINSASLLNRYSDDALDIYIISHLAEAGDDVGVKESLNLKLDTYVYEISSLLSSSGNTEESKKAEEILVKISLHRMTFPRKAENQLQKEVDEVLLRYKK